MSSNFEEIIKKAEETVDKLKDRVERDKTLDDKLNIQFKKNKAAFSKYMPHVLEDIKDIDLPEDFLFYTEEGFLNIKHIHNNIPLYSDNPVKDVEKQIEDFISNPDATRIQYSKEENPRNQLHVKYINRMLDHQKVLNEEEPLNKVPEKVPSIVVFGIGLGYHLQPIFEKIDSNHYFLYEPEPCYFIASLYIFDWDMLFEKVNMGSATLNINIGTDPEKYHADYIGQIDINGRYSAGKTFLYWHYKTPEMIKAITGFSRSYNKQISGVGFFDDGIFSIAHGMKNFKNSIPILKQKKHIAKESYKKIENIPVFLIGNGPSLDGAIDTIKCYQDKAIIMACGTTISTLYRYGLKPDIQLDVERTKHSADKFRYLPTDFLKDILALSVNVMHPELFGYFEKKAYGLKPGEAISSLMVNSFGNEKFQQMDGCNPLVGNLALSYSEYFGFKNLYLFGFDTGYKVGGNHHSKKSIYYSEGANKVKAVSNYVQESGINVKGNFGGEVFSSYLMDMSRNVANSSLSRMSKAKGFYCFNTSDGVAFDNTFPLLVDDILITESNINKADIINGIYEEFFESSLPDYSDLEKNLKTESFNMVVDRLLGYIEKSELSRRGDFLDLLKSMVLEVNPYRVSKNKDSHIYYLIMGSLTTLSLIILNTLYNYQNEDKVVKCAKNMIVEWRHFLVDMKDRYKNVASWFDIYEWDGMKLFEEPKSLESEEGDKNVH